MTSILLKIEIEQIYNFVASERNLSKKSNLEKMLYFFSKFQDNNESDIKILKDNNIMFTANMKYYIINLNSAPNLLDRNTALEWLFEKLY